ncbi:unnamed protein product [Cyprideis torosa]|uniref:Uncharacterized protein n=1 Tax=Cyprideis torosa TaxID=163714 RepID=A0A7R8ZLK6_9CRUS|nr:unnamed protein product [Cyprideis torosa]CAG0892082.1 unnamed protein product [Cyprideis torosa]
MPDMSLTGHIKLGDFSQDYASVYARHADELIEMLEKYRTKNNELASESTLFESWNRLLQEIEEDARVAADLSHKLSSGIARSLPDRTFHSKIQAKKVFQHRETCETILSKQDEGIRHAFRIYSSAYEKFVREPNLRSRSALIRAQNDYLLQVNAANSMIKAYSEETLPKLLEELEDVYVDTTDAITEVTNQFTDFLTKKELQLNKDGRIVLSRHPTGVNLSLVLHERVFPTAPPVNVPHPLHSVTPRSRAQSAGEEMARAVQSGQALFEKRID